MTVTELRVHPEYKKAVDIIKNYKKGFKFTINYAKIPKAKANALRIVLNDCEKAGLIESIEFGLSLQGEIVDESFKRL